MFKICQSFRQPRSLDDCMERGHSTGFYTSGRLVVQGSIVLKPLFILGFICDSSRSTITNTLELESLPL